MGVLTENNSTSKSINNLFTLFVLLVDKNDENVFKKIANFVQRRGNILNMKRGSLSQYVNFVQRDTNNNQYNTCVHDVA